VYKIFIKTFSRTFAL